LLLAVSQPIHLASVMLGNRPLDLVGWGGTAVGFAAAGWALLRMNNDEFDLPPEPAQG
jgi:homogentisate 1,2-dioxygenase